MSDYLKYLKYKKKYLELKKKLNSLNLIKQLGGGRKVKTIGNTGALEGMTFQCFWISILDYLKNHGYPDLTLRQLRKEADLGRDTEHTAFDIDYLIGPELNRRPIFLNAAEKIAKKYNLRIEIFSADRTGETEISTHRAVIGEGSNLVEIAQFGIIHFELIDENRGTEFQPAVMIKGELTKKISDHAMQFIYTELSENQAFLKFLNDQLKVNSAIYEKELKNKKDLMSSPDLTPDQKSIFLTQQDEELNHIVTQINSIEKKIGKLEEDISSLIVIIADYEESL